MFKDIVEVVRHEYENNKTFLWTWSPDAEHTVTPISDERIKGILRVAPQCTYVDYGREDGIVGFELQFVEGEKRLEPDEIDEFYTWVEDEMGIRVKPWKKTTIREVKDGIILQVSGYPSVKIWDDGEYLYADDTEIAYIN